MEVVATNQWLHSVNIFIATSLTGDNPFQWVGSVFCGAQMKPKHPEASRVAIPRKSISSTMWNSNVDPIHPLESFNHLQAETEVVLIRFSRFTTKHLYTLRLDVGYTLRQILIAEHIDRCRYLVRIVELRHVLKNITIRENPCRCRPIIWCLWDYDLWLKRQWIKRHGVVVVVLPTLSNSGSYSSAIMFMCHVLRLERQVYLNGENNINECESEIKIDQQIIVAKRTIIDTYTRAWLGRVLIMTITSSMEWVTCWDYLLAMSVTTYVPNTRSCMPLWCVDSNRFGYVRGWVRWVIGR